MTEYTRRELALLVIDSLEGFEYKHEKLLLKAVSAPENLFDFPQKAKDYLFANLSEQKAKTVMLSLNIGYAETVVDFLDKRGVRAITIFSEDYPERLKNIDTPPLVLYAKGNIGLLKEKNTLAAVGSRKTLPYAEALLKDVCATVGRAGVTLVTGSATGADRAVITSALDNGNKVISVLAGGIDHVYPDCNKSLIEKVCKNGLVISEQPPRVAPVYWMFPVRNRIIAGLGDALLIASGDKKSGAKHTADFALEYGRQIFAFPYSVGITSGELCNELIKKGACLCDGYEDILGEFNLTYDKEENAVLLEGDEKTLYDAIASGIEDMTVYCIKNNLKFYEIAPTLSSLEIQGFIVKTVGNRYKPVK